MGCFAINEENDLWNADAEIAEAIGKECDRQRSVYQMIASENYVHPAVLAANGSVLTNKYAEGYPTKRYYGGCENVDVVEQLAIDRLKKLFNCNYANVQPHSGSNANLAAYHALCENGDDILGLDLTNGGHLTHGSKVNFSGRYYNSHFYSLDPHTGTLDYDEILKVAKAVNPKVIVAGYSAYPRTIDFKQFRKICDEVGAYLLVDIAHIAGLVATGEHPSPFPYADVVTTTTQKTLRGPHGGAIMTNDEEIAKKIDKAVFPGTQGGPLMNTIAAKAVCFRLALQPEFKQYAKNIKENANELAKGLQESGVPLVSGGTDNHLCLANVKAVGLTGLEAEELLAKYNIIVNKNTIPGETESPFVTSGIRLGTPALTTRGFEANQFYVLGHIIGNTLIGKKMDPEQELLLSGWSKEKSIY